MWIIRFLNGPQVGQIVPITRRSVSVGRGAHCDIKISSQGVSKEHLKIDVLDDVLLISDNGSRNGTFINGTQIRSAKIRPGDKVTIHDLIFEVQNVPEAWVQQFQMMQAMPMHAANPQAFYGQAAPQLPGYDGPGTSHSPNEEIEESKSDFANNFSKYQERIHKLVDKEILPGVFKLPEVMEFKWVLAGFMAVFIFAVTSLSTIPLIRILKVSLEEESQQHALTIATSLARVNRSALMQGLESAVTVDIALNRPGVRDAYIISNVDGQIVAPASKAGTYPDAPYIHQGRKMSRESVSQVDDSTVVAMVPIEFYNSETGTQAATAFSVVFYDMSSIAVDDSQVLSLFITTLFIALLLGAILFYFLYKIFEYPFVSLNRQLDIALKDGHDQISINYQFAPLQKLASNLGSALSRVSHDNPSGGAAMNFEVDRSKELSNLIQLVGFAAIGIQAVDLSITGMNEAFEQRTGLSSINMVGRTLNDVTDQALKLSLKDLVDRIDQNPTELAQNELEFSGANFQLIAQGVHGQQGLAYYLIILVPQNEGE